MGHGQKEYRIIRPREVSGQKQARLEGINTSVSPHPHKRSTQISTDSRHEETMPVAVQRKRSALEILNYVRASFRCFSKGPGVRSLSAAWSFPILLDDIEEKCGLGKQTGFLGEVTEKKTKGHGDQPHETKLARRHFQDSASAAWPLERRDRAALPGQRPDR